TISKRDWSSDVCSSDLSYAVVILAFGMTSLDSWRSLGNDLFFVLFNSIFILFTYPLILLFEKGFKVTTDFSLLELSDTNLPLLKIGRASCRERVWVYVL